MPLGPVIVMMIIIILLICAFFEQVFMLFAVLARIFTVIYLK